MLWGGDCYSYGLLANGWLDGVVKELLEPYDFFALYQIVMGAGGWMGDQIAALKTRVIAADKAVQDFRSAPAVEEALYLMVASYDQLGLEQLRDDARRVLVQNFPHSALLEKGYGNSGKSWWKFF